MYKVVIKGFFEFGNSKTYEKALRVFQQQRDTVHKNELLLKEPEIFNEVSATMDVFRLILPTATEKSWKNTISIIECMSQFAITGIFYAWRVDEKNNIINEYIIEPQNDKAAVQEYLNGRTLIQQGKTTEALDALNKAIDKYERHAPAFVQRGYLYERMENKEDAILDYTKAIEINPAFADAFVGRAQARINLEDYAGAIDDLNHGLSNSVPNMQIYWRARCLKGMAHYRLGEFKESAFDFKFFTKRHYSEDNINYPHLPNALSTYSKVLNELGEKVEADLIQKKLTELKNVNNKIVPA